MLNHWPSGGRDTTEFPSFSITVSPILREHLGAFIKLQGVGWNDFERQRTVAGLDITPQRYRSYRKLYQSLGLIYESNGNIAISRLGNQMAKLPGYISSHITNEVSKTGKIALDILSRYQLRNPTESQLDELPLDCDVLPCICIWKSMLVLDNKLHYEEINRVILRIMTMSELDAGVERIRQARTNIFPYSAQEEPSLIQSLGEPVHLEQQSARIAPWFSFAGWGGLLIEQNPNSDGFRQLVPSMITDVRNITAQEHKYFNFNNEEEWIQYYIGIQNTSVLPAAQATQLNTLGESFEEGLKESGMTLPTSIINRLVSSLCAKRFLILTGLSGSGKTKLAQAFAQWITKDESMQIDPFAVGNQIKSDRINYHVYSADSTAVTFSNKADSNKATKVCIPRELITEWVTVIKDKAYDRNTQVRRIREDVEKTTNYSTQINSFETHLKAAAFAIIEAQNNNDTQKAAFNVIPVGADWTNREPIFGYPNALTSGDYQMPTSGALQLIIRAADNARQNQTKPYFIILDEMNLSHVERYFADLLSAMESGREIRLHEPGEYKAKDGSLVPEEVILPPNLFVIGTVNVDETTYMFSPKVLDRANVIEFTVSHDEIASFLDNPTPVDLSQLAGKGTAYAQPFVEQAIRRDVTLEDLGGTVKKDVKKALEEFFSMLAPVGAEFGYRPAFEITRFIYFHAKVSGEGWKLDDALDAAIMQKLLPKLHGSKTKLGPVLAELEKICPKEKYPLTAAKIYRMGLRLKQNGFTSYTEA